MSEDLWTVTEHVISASHIRGFPRGVRDEQKGNLRLSVKQYTRRVDPGYVSLIVAHGIGSSKELYEPLLDEILRQGLPIRSAWSVDVAHHGQSYLLNEAIIGDEPHWLDSARDMLHVVNHFQAQMPPPIYGIGQSWGCCNILMMSSFHSRLFAGMIMMEPTFETGFQLQPYGQTAPWKHSEARPVLLARRRDVWPSRNGARVRLRKNPYYAKYDPRVFERFVKYSLRDRPTPEHPDAVTLTTPKAQDVYTFCRPDPPFPGFTPAPDYKNRSDETILVPGFYRAEITHIKRALREIYPPILYLWGTISDIGNSAYSQRIIDQTGVGGGGGGGALAGQVVSRYIEGADHLIPYKFPEKAAEAITDWLRVELEKWNEEVKRQREQPPFNSGVLNPLWLERFSKL